MTTPAIHAADALTFASLSALALQELGLPLGAITVALVVSVWAVARDDTYTRKQALCWWIGGVGFSLAFTSGTAELISHFFGVKPQLQWLSGVMAFVFIDKPARTKVLSFFATKAERIEVKND